MTRTQRGGIIFFVLMGLLAAVIIFHERLLPERVEQQLHHETPAAAPPAPTAAAAPPATDPAPAPAPAAAPRPEPLELSPATVAADPPAGGGTLAGRVVSRADGAGVAGAELTFASDSGTWSVVSTSGGAFAFSPPAPGRYALVSALAEGYLPFAPAWGRTPIAFHGRPQKRISGARVELSPAVEYFGQVLDPAGQPLADASVRLVFPQGAAPSLAPIPNLYRSGPDGRFIFIAPDDTRLRASHPDFAPAWGRVDYKVQISKRLVLTLSPSHSAPRTGRITGRVLTADGGPADGARVVASRRTHHHHGRGSRETHLADCDPAGKFALTELTESAFALRARLPGHAPSDAQRASVGDREVTLRLGPALQGRISGSARDRDGAPVPAFTVIVSRPGRLGTETEIRHAAIFDPAGRYSVGGLAPGRYRVRAAAAGLAPSAPVAVELPDPPEQPARADLELGPGGSLVGRVLSAAGERPLAGARVTIESNFGYSADPLPVAASAVSDAAGRFRLDGLAAGRQSVTATAAGHHARIVSQLDIAPGRTLGPIEIRLNPLDEDEEPTLELAGIGAVLYAGDKSLVITRILPAGGAAAAGLKRGDAILAVDHHPVPELGFEAAIQGIRGPEHSTVLLTVRRPGGQPADVVVTRRQVAAR